MRISYLLPKCTPDNSHGRYVIELVRRIAGKHSITIYAGQFWRPLKSIANCRVLPVLQRPALARLASLWLESLLAVRCRSSDVVHVQGADAPIGNVVTAHFCNQSVRALNRSDGGVYRRFNYALGAAAEKHCFTRYSVGRIIAVSRMLKNEIVNHYGVDAEKVIVIHHGVDPEAFHPRNRLRWRETVRQSHGIGAGDCVVLYVGGDYRRKGLVTLVEALRRLPREVKVLAVGVGLDTTLNNIGSESGLAGRITFLPPTEHVGQFYAAADLFVLPTVYDTFSLATLEAMASGLPVVVSARAGVSEILRHGSDSLLLADPTDPEELAHSLRRLTSEETLRRHLGSEARSTAELHSWDRVVSETVGVYERTMVHAA